MLWLETRLDNHRAQSLFARLGVVEFARTADDDADGATAIRCQKYLWDLGHAADAAALHKPPLRADARLHLRAQRPDDVDGGDRSPHRTSDHAAAGGRSRKVINLCRIYDYLSIGYYRSLIAEARNERVTPTVETITEMPQRPSSLPALAELSRSRLHVRSP